MEQLDGDNKYDAGEHGLQVTWELCGGRLTGSVLGRSVALHTGRPRPAVGRRFPQLLVTVDVLTFSDFWLVMVCTWACGV